MLEARQYRAAEIGRGRSNLLPVSLFQRGVDDSWRNPDSLRHQGFEIGVHTLNASTALCKNEDSEGALHGDAEAQCKAPPSIVALPSTDGGLE
jgi:hypothetical protein